VSDVAEGRLADAFLLARARLERVLDDITEGVTILAPDGRFLYANAAAARLIGVDSAEELLAMPYEEARKRFTLYRPDGSQMPAEELPGRRALAGEDGGTVVVRFRTRAGGPERLSIVRATPVLDASGAVQYVVNYFREITDETRRVELLLRVQHEVTAILTEAESVDTALPRVLESVAELLDWDVGAYWPVTRDASDAACGSLYARPGFEAFGAATRAHRARRGVSLAGEIWESGEPSWLDDLAERTDLPQAAEAEAVGITTGFGFPAIVGGEVVGILEFFSRRFREPDPQLLDVVAALGRNVGQFVRRQHAEEERERLLVAEQRARAEAEAAALTLRKLGLVAEAALEHVSLRGLLDALLARLIDVLSADTAAILLVDEETRNLRMRATVGFAEELELAVPIPLGEGMAGRVAASRSPLLVHDLDEIELASPVLRARGIKSLVAIPLVVEDQLIGVVHAGSERRGHFTPEDQRLLELMADRIALAINQSALYEAEQAAQDRLAVLAEASQLLASALDPDSALERLGALVVGRVADWCVFHLADERGRARLVAIAHRDRERAARVREYLLEQEPWPGAERAVGHVIRTGEPELIEKLPAHLAEWIRDEGLHSALIVPLRARGRTLGALSLVWAETPRSYAAADIGFAEDLARRAGVAVDNAQLYREAAERAQAARVLASVGDGVVLVDRGGIVRYWNRAAAAMLGLAAAEIIDRPLAELIPAWTSIAERVPVAAEGATSPRPESLPLALGDRELWLSIAGVEVADGVVYAFRDLTEDRALDELKTEFVSTVSHELRTPLAAIYGAAMTLRRSDVVLDESHRESLLGVISNEADRLARTVNDILWASRLDTNTLRVAIERCDPLALTREVVEAQGTHLPEGIEVRVVPDENLPEVIADPDKVRQVLVNLVDNAVKYSPDGGRVEVRIAAAAAHVRFTVTDEGLGIPYAEQRRIFEKFYRLDPNMTRGISGTGLGLYICRELLRRMNGRITVDSEPGRGSAFAFELPIAGPEPV
jgi:PAS domain S-box-containing protein